MALALLCLPVFADYQASYRKGMQAFDRKNWSGVLEWMGRAARERNTEGGDKVNLYGMRFEHYLPHYYMGVAHFESGDPAAAEAEWQISQRQGAIQRTPQKRDLQKYLRRQEEAKADQRRALDEALTEAQNEIDRAVAADSEIDRLKQEATSRQVFQEDPSLENDRKSAAELLGSARSGLQRGSKDNDIASVKAAKDQAGRARTRFEGITGKVTRRTRGILAEIAERESTELAQALAAAQKALDEADAAAGVLNQLKQESNSAAVFRQNPSLGNDENTASSLLRSARSTLDEARRQSDQAKAGEALSQARQARTQLESVTQRVRQRSGELLAERTRREAATLDQAVRAAQSEIDRATSAGAALDRARRDTVGAQAFRENAALEQGRQKAMGDLEASRNLLQEGRTQQAQDRVTAARDQARQARLQFEDLSRQVAQRVNEIQAEIRGREVDAPPETRPDASGPPAELIASARAYFSGEYSEALTILQGTEFSDQRSALQAHLFRAAAQYALFLTGGGGDRQLLDEARRHLQACRRLDADFIPDNRAFTPRFIAFFRQGP